VSVLGKGLLGQAFCAAYPDSERVIIAAGVSNSLETDLSEFRREETLVKKAIDTGKELAYFSTCSLLGAKATPYTEHKARMEELIGSNAVGFSIFRLPQVVGVVRNNTLVSFFIGKLVASDTLRIQESALRYLIAVEDVVRLAGSLWDSGLSRNKTVNIAPSHAISALLIARTLKAMLGSSSRIETIPGGDSYQAPTPELSALLEPSDPILSERYAESVLARYAHKIASLYT
jgi:hypothetical protein